MNDPRGERRPPRPGRLPFLVSVPHAGSKVPEAWRERCVLGLRDIMEDADEQARAIYDLSDEVMAFVSTDVARAVVDLNRAPDDLRPDGVVKTETCWKKAVWQRPLDGDDRQRLLADVYFPYHDRLSRPPRGVRCGLDLHTMAATAPPIAARPGEPRPVACISYGDGTAPRAWVEALADALADVLPERPRINEPFQGGHITRFHAREMPWIQLELNRGGFMSVAKKRAAVRSALRRFAYVVEATPDIAVQRARGERPSGRR